MIRSKCSIYIIILAINSAIGSSYLDKQEFMDLGKAEKRYGVSTFSASNFRRGNSESRGKMAVSLIKSKIFIGKTVGQVKQELGDFTGNFWNDNVPAYLIEEGWKDSKDTWQLVFLLDNEEKVTDVRIHKNCCSK